ncbi:SDR family NAD(P)-dependent oxidoreductase [Geodermatophilus sp. TF02-6]|uniref:SDR family NAD(P)-dependent oxidoreductase n=1 Tax=Geodermatophilus sp. TF02-6 TaxID=2250575 RepID=UPI0021073F20|nr:SDR family NAD(P)-dependent oxidoreductase [Geodermatophilus sp. TF02-6]
MHRERRHPPGRGRPGTAASGHVRPPALPGAPDGTRSILHPATAPGWGSCPAPRPILPPAPRSRPARAGLVASGAGDVLFVGSTAGLVSYEGGASYTAAKHGVHTLAETLRLEPCGEPVRVIEIAPGMVRTEEFGLNRVGDPQRAEAVYRGVREPLVAEDVADCIAWALTRPHHVDVDLLVVRPRAQAAQHKVFREG